MRVFLQAAVCCATVSTSVSRPVSMSNTKPRTVMLFAIHGCDLTVAIWSRVFWTGSLNEKKRIGVGEASPVEAASLAFNSPSVNVVNPQPVWLRSMISVVPRTRVETTSSPRTSSVTAGPPVRITSISACGNPRISGRFERRGSMHVTTAIFGAGRCPSFGSCLFAYLRFASSALSIILIVGLQIDLQQLEKDRSHQEHSFDFHNRHVH